MSTENKMKQIDNKREKTHKELKAEWESYKQPSKLKLEKKVPVFMKLGMVAPKTFSKGFRKPVDPVLEDTMNNVMKEMCMKIQGCVFAYAAKNELEFVVTDYHKLNSDAWLDYDLANMQSQLASLATCLFIKYFEEAKEKFYDEYEGEDKQKLYAVYNRALDESYPLFKARCFNVPESRVVDMIYYRQRENLRNVVQNYAKHYMSKGDVVGHTIAEIKDSLREKVGINFDKDIPTAYKHGVACHKGENPFTTKTKWGLDMEMPMLSWHDADYLLKIMNTVRHPDEREKAVSLSDVPEIIAYRGSKDIDVKFSDGSIKNMTYDEFQEILK